MSEQKIKITFAPGSFDHFDGSQEDLDNLISEITRLVESGELFEQSRELDIDTLIDDDPELAEMLMNSIDADKRTLQ